MKKLRVDGEICSEIMDLIIDIGNEMWDKQTKKGQKKLTQEEWRNWKSIFVDGRYLSHVMAEDSSTPHDHIIEYLPELEADEEKDLETLLFEMKSDPAYADFLEFVAGSGQFNFDWDVNGMWSRLPFNVNTEGDHLAILDNFLMPFNHNLFDFMQKVYAETSQPSTEIIADSNVPDHLPLKLCITGK